MHMALQHQSTICFLTEKDDKECICMTRSLLCLYHSLVLHAVRHSKQPPGCGSTRHYIKLRSLIFEFNACL